MISFAETKNQRPFDWNKFLSQEDNTEEDWENAEIIAYNWISCACGVQCSIIPRKQSGEPEDILLSIYGKSFHNKIKIRDKVHAKIVLEQIEIRSQQLIDEINKKNNV